MSRKITIDQSLAEEMLGDLFSPAASLFSELSLKFPKLSLRIEWHHDPGTEGDQNDGMEDYPLLNEAVNGQGGEITDMGQAPEEE